MNLEEAKKEAELIASDSLPIAVVRYFDDKSESDEYGYGPINRLTGLFGPHEIICTYPRRLK